VLDEAAGDRRAEVPGDVVSAPTHTWPLPLLGDGVATAVRAMTAAGAPVPLTTLTVRDLTVAVPAATVVLSVENPRLLEAAAQQRLPAPVVCTSGVPTTGTLALLDALVAAGAHVRHHGDVDVGGLGITGRWRAAASCRDGWTRPRTAPEWTARRPTASRSRRSPTPTPSRRRRGTPRCSTRSATSASPSSRSA
jgi:hypothetical protein